MGSILRDQLKAFLFSVTGWAIFFLAGLPTHYFQDLSFPFMIGFSLIALIPFWAICIAYLMWFEGQSQFRNGIVLAIHLFIWPFLCDWMYFVYTKPDLGIGFLIKYWYLTLFYILPLIFLPPTGRWLERRKKERALVHGA
jgi:hypothetical protein